MVIDAVTTLVESGCPGQTSKAGSNETVVFGIDGAGAFIRDAQCVQLDELSRHPDGISCRRCQKHAYTLALQDRVCTWAFRLNALEYATKRLLSDDEARDYATWWLAQNYVVVRGDAYASRIRRLTTQETHRVCDEASHYFILFKLFLCVSSHLVLVHITPRAAFFEFCRCHWVVARCSRSLS